MFTQKDCFQTKVARKRFAEFLSFTVNGCFGFEPYCPNKEDTTFWVIDIGNDWKVKFDEQDWSTFEIIYRYEHPSNKAEETLASWLVFRTKAIIIAN